MGIMVMTRAGGVLRQSGSAFEGDKGKTYARVVVKMIESVIKGIEELEEGVSRIATSTAMLTVLRHFIM
jgi:hypothetical protein